MTHTNTGDTITSVRLPSELHARLKAEAERQDRSVSATVRRLIERHLDEVAPVTETAA